MVEKLKFAKFILSLSFIHVLHALKVITLSLNGFVAILQSFFIGVKCADNL